MKNDRFRKSVNNLAIIDSLLFIGTESHYSDTLTNVYKMNLNKIKNPEEENVDSYGEPIFFVDFPIPEFPRGALSFKRYMTKLFTDSRLSKLTKKETLNIVLNINSIGLVEVIYIDSSDNTVIEEIKKVIAKSVKWKPGSARCPRFDNYFRFKIEITRKYLIFKEINASIYEYLFSFRK